MSDTARSHRLGRILLRLYPRDFREQFGDDLMLIFRDAWRAAGRGPRAWSARAGLTFDMLKGAGVERLATRRQRLPTPDSHHPNSRLTMRDLISEFRQAIRSLVRAPGFSLAVILTLALGIGANTAIFSVVDGVLLRPAPFESMDRLTMIWETDRKSGTLREPASIPDYWDLRERTQRFEQLAAFSPYTGTVRPASGDPERVAALVVSHEFLPMVGITPILGTTFTAEQDRDGAPVTALISEGYWTERFARSNEAIGTVLQMDGSAVTIIGVLPASADFGTLQILGAAAYRRGYADRGGHIRVDVWVSLRARRTGADRGNHPIFVMGRLAPGVTRDQGQQEMTAITADLERMYHDANDGRGAFVEPLGAVVFGGVKPALLVLIGAVGLVLLVACANVANLLLARGAVRAREVSVRAALGASAGRLTRQFLVESAVLTGTGAVLGILLALGGLQVLRALAPGSIPRVDAVGVDLRVLGITLVLTAIVGTTFGLVPAVQARRRGPDLHLQAEGARGASSGREHRRFRSALVVAELALAVVLMVGAGLLIKSLWRLYQVNPGFETSGVLKAEFQLPPSYSQRMSEWPEWRDIRRFAELVREKVSAIPGVTSVAMAGAHPLEAGYTSSIVIVGKEAEAADYPEPAIRLVDSGYFRTMRVRLVAGRPMTDDGQATRVIGLNEAARKRFFGTQDPLGHQVQLWGAPRTVVAVFADERFHGLAAEATPALYLPASQAPIPNGSILVRTNGDPALLAGAVRRAVREVDPTVLLHAIEPLSVTLAQTTAQPRFTMLVLGVFAAIALVLAMVGVHGVLSYTVAQRTREIGIRMALGADRDSVRGLVLGQGARLVAAGLALGLAGAIGLSRLLASLLYGVHPNDPMTLVLVAVGLGAVALVASWLPARRAARVDPLVALRAE